jgi:hypothetical protein
VKQARDKARQAAALSGERKTVLTAAAGLDTPANTAKQTLGT